MTILWLRPKRKPRRCEVCQGSGKVYRRVYGASANYAPHGQLVASPCAQCAPPPPPKVPPAAA